MKLVWKMFFTIMFVSATCLAVGSYLLLQSNMKALLKQEVQTAYDYGDIAYYSLANQLQTAQGEAMDRLAEEGEGRAARLVAAVAPGMTINAMNQTISFAILEETGAVVYSAFPNRLDKNILSQLNDDRRGWVLQQEGERVYLQAVRPALLCDTLFYLETVREVTDIFSAQTRQYETLFHIMLGMLLFAGVTAFVMSKLMASRIVALSKITKEIAAGNLSRRGREGGGDEIGQLSQNFNQMADDLEETIHHLREEASRRERFVGAVSHELKTPLTAIIGYSDMLARQEVTPERLHICADYIRREGKRLEALSMRLLDLIVLKNQKLRRTPVDISAFLAEVCALLAPQIAGREIVLTCRLEEAQIEMEPDLMKTALLNLLDNAQKAMDHGGEIHIIGTWCNADYILSIRDTGKGMEEQELSKIREAFYMVDRSRSRQQGGAGLGLAICDEILTLHGFGIHFESQPNWGTTVNLTLKGAAYD